MNVEAYDISYRGVKKKEYWLSAFISLILFLSIQGLCSDPTNKQEEKKKKPLKVHAQESQV